MSKRSKHSSAAIEAFVKRYLQGESVVALAKEAHISRPGFYLWIDKYKDTVIEVAKRANMSAPDIEQSKAVDLKIENRALKEERDMLKRKLFDLMLETGRI